MQITRRQILAAAAAVPVAGALGAGAVVWRWWDRPPGQGLKALSVEEHGFIQAMAEGWMPRGGTPELSGADARIGDFVDDVVAAMHHRTGAELRLLMHALDHLTVPVCGARFQHLSVATRSRVLEGWMDHPSWMIRDAASGVLVLVGMGWTTHPEVAAVLRPMFRCGYGR